MDKITEQDLANRGVKGLPDVPGLTTEEMQRKLEEIAREILIPKVNELVEGLNNANSNLNGFIPVTETGTTTSRAYNFGEVIRYGNNLYVATQNIAQGTNINDAIIVGYFVATNVVSKINGLNNNLLKKIVISHNDLTFDNGICNIEGGEYAVVSVMPIGIAYTCGLYVTNLSPVTYAVKIRENETYSGTFTCRIVYVK